MNTAISMNAPQRRLCLEVAWEIDAVARVLPGLVPRVADSDGAADPHFVVRAMAGRLLRLSSVLMGLADGDDDPDTLMRVFDLQAGQG